MPLTEEDLADILRSPPLVPIRKNGTKRTEHGKTRIDPTDPLKGLGAADVVRPCPDGSIPAGGGRNAELYRWFCKLRANGADKAFMLAEWERMHAEGMPLAHWNPDRPDEVGKCADSACTKPCGTNVPPPPPPPGTARPSKGLPPESVHTFLMGDDVEFAEAVGAVLEGDGPPIVWDGGQLWIYRPSTGIWAKLLDTIPAVTFHDFRGARVAAGRDKDGNPKWTTLKVTDKKTDDVVKTLKKRRRVEDFFVDPPAGIATTNGFVRVSASGVLHEPASPDHKTLVAFPWAWNPDAAAPLWEKYLGEVLDEDGAATLQEFFGVTLCGVAPRFQKMLAVQGEAGTGKSVAAEILTALVPESAVSHVDPSELHDMYAVARLKGKILNVVDDAPDKDVGSGRFKAVITGNPVDGRQPYGPIHGVRNRAGFASFFNDPLHTRDVGKGFWDRILPLVFDKAIHRGTSHEIRDLHKAIVEAGELPGIARWALEGAVRAFRQDRYTGQKAAADTFATWQTDADPARRFVADVCTPDPVGQSFDSLYTVYATWARNNGQDKPLDALVFSRRLKNAGFPTFKNEKGDRCKALKIAIRKTA